MAGIRPLKSWPLSLGSKNHNTLALFIGEGKPRHSGRVAFQSIQQTESRALTPYLSFYGCTEGNSMPRRWVGRLFSPVIKTVCGYSGDVTNGCSKDDSEIQGP